MSINGILGVSMRMGQSCRRSAQRAKAHTGTNHEGRYRMETMDNETTFTLTLPDIKIVFDGLCAFGLYCSDIDDEKLLSDVEEFTTRLGDWLDKEGIVFDE